MHGFCWSIKNVHISTPKKLPKWSEQVSSLFLNTITLLKVFTMLLLQVTPPYKMHRKRCMCFPGLFQMRKCAFRAHLFNTEKKSRHQKKATKIGTETCLLGTVWKPPPQVTYTVSSPLSQAHWQEGITVVADIGDLLSLIYFLLRFTEE